MDVGTSGGVFGLDRGYCLMIGGPDAAVKRLDPILKALAPGKGRRGPHAGPREAQGQHGRGWLPALRSRRRRPFREDGPQRHRVRDDGRLRRGAQHHQERQRRQEGPDGRPAPRSRRCATPSTSSTTSTWPTSPSSGAAAAWWRPWLLDLTASALAEDPELSNVKAEVPDSGEGPLDRAGRHRRGRAGHRADRLALPALHVARRRRVRLQDASRRCGGSSADIKNGGPRRAPQAPRSAFAQEAEPAQKRSVFFGRPSIRIAPGQVHVNALLV